MREKQKQSRTNLRTPIKLKEKNVLFSITIKIVYHLHWLYHLLRFSFPFHVLFPFVSVALRNILDNICCLFVFPLHFHPIRDADRIRLCWCQDSRTRNLINQPCAGSSPRRPLFRATLRPQGIRTFDMASPAIFFVSLYLYTRLTVVDGLACRLTGHVSAVAHGPRAREGAESCAWPSTRRHDGANRSSPWRHPRSDPIRFSALRLV